MVFVGSELSFFDRCTGGEDTSELTFNEFAGFWRFHLIADSDFFSSLEEFINISIRSMMRDTGHGGAMALSESKAKKLRGEFGVGKKEFKKIP